jgi:hypothetical protein
LIVVAGRTLATPLTEEQVRRDCPEGDPQRVEGSLQVRYVAETAAEMLEQIEPTPSTYGPSH